MIKNYLIIDRVTTIDIIYFIVVIHVRELLDCKSTKNNVDLFKSTKQNISLHINNIFKDGKLQRNSVVKEYLTTEFSLRRHHSNSSFLRLFRCLRSYHLLHLLYKATGSMKGIASPAIPTNSTSQSRGNTMDASHTRTGMTTTIVRRARNISKNTAISFMQRYSLSVTSANSLSFQFMNHDGRRCHRAITSHPFWESRAF